MENSNLAKVPEPHEGQSDPDFDRQMVLANALGSFVQAAHECGGRFRRDGVAVTSENIRNALILAVSTLLLRSMLCGLVTDDHVIEQLIDAAFANFFVGADP